MNAPIRNLYLLFLVLFGVLVYFTSKNAVFDAEALRDNTLNRRPLLEEQRIHRGTIRAADGTVVARSIKQRGDVYTRRYPTNGLFQESPVTTRCEGKASNNRWLVSLRIW